ncbi:hypothetical protein NE237_006518 [Protea cynaroides]|uniref:UMP-CMP kinase n=1 Tax=Protea cynaroides TaxID=273540 RepID=A0A9Q0KNA7_9MAGN|nr:hypothetical protein NE237_006518 [Protea cynaroides]
MEVKGSHEDKSVVSFHSKDFINLQCSRRDLTAAGRYQYFMGTIIDAAEPLVMVKDANEIFSDNKITCIFVLGGPGSGKGTQCEKIVEHFGFTHLSTGDLLKAEMESNSENGTTIRNMRKEGKIVPSEVTIKLLQRAMQESGNNKFLIDGFPRNEENRAAFENIMNIQPDFVFFFKCSEEERKRRILNRNQGRDDDNIDTILKRFKVYEESTLPIIEYYRSKGKICEIDAERPVEEVFEVIYRQLVERMREGTDVEVCRKEEKAV